LRARTLYPVTGRWWRRFAREEPRSSKTGPFRLRCSAGTNPPWSA